MPEPEPAPTAPDPADELQALLAELAEEVAATNGVAFAKWSEQASKLAAFDEPLAGFTASLPSEAERIERIRDRIKSFATAVKKKNKKLAKKTLASLEAETQQ